MAQFPELRRENIIQLEPARQLLRDVQISTAVSEQIGFLKQAEIRGFPRQHIGDLVQARAAINVPVDHLDVIERFRDREITLPDFIGRVPNRCRE